ncbi:MAG TPA: DEAD/DEAH box helicase, partial [Phaeodactylibacter sp.]|nr:DEAD/DEAH box helicase [Phaeodactylibacter sp.]
LHTFEEENVFIEWLQNIPRGEITKYAEVVRTMSLVYDFAEQLCVRAAYIPQLLEVGQTQHYIIRWLPALLNPTISSIFSGLQSILSEDILFYKNGEDVDEPVDADKATALTSFFLQYLVKTHHDLTHQFKEHEVGHLFFNGAALLFNDFETKDYPAAIQLWLNKLYLTKKDFVPVIQVDAQGDGFELNLAIEEAKNKKTDTPIPLSKILSFKKYQKIRMDVLRDVAMLADYFPQISELVASEGKEPLYFDANTFVNVLFKILPTIRLFGIKVLLPKALRKLVRPQLSMKINAEKGVVATASMLNLKELLSFQWQVAMGDEHLSVRHFMKMVKDYSGIVKLNDQYVFFDKEEIQKLIEKLEAPPTLDSKELLQAALSEDYQGAKVMLDAKVKKLMDKLLHGKDAKVPKGLKATLRPYQLDGYRWLYKNTRIGFGSLIADDMGLGKTLQVITTLLKLKEDKALGKEKALIVVPTTLLTNWQNEIQRFAPKLSSHIYHGAGRTLKPIKDADILLTTYGVARNETAALKKHNWLVLVIDEAQNIKNPSTAQTKAIKRINAKIKIAMSGTPVENRLSEYWSIFDFTNKGYLDSLPKFKRAFAKPIEIERDQMKLERFRKITAPFILRRLKSDKSIIKDLPEKIEKDQYCQLTPDQAALYQNVVNQTMDSISESEGIERKGNILKLITALKQVCNHPQHFLKKKNPLPEDSGKTQMLFTLMNSILQNDEKTLIFTQYQEMGQHLVNMIQDEFGLSVPFLHGGISRKGRDHMVNTFQNDRATRILILSLKAGGTGLNLTAANNVIHYDLWWNPAVEAQATDRAYRIGQRKNVLVHRFITKGTFEEKINELLKSKKELADLTVATGEKWIGDYSNEELKDLVTLEEKK